MVRRKNEIGLQVTAKNRDVILAELEEAVRTNILKINSQRLIDELFTFIVTDTGKIQADRGKHDDLIMGLAAGTHAFRAIIESTPLEYASKLGKREDKFLLPSTGKNKKIYQGLSRENYKWVIG